MSSKESKNSHEGKKSSRSDKKSRLHMPKDDIYYHGKKNRKGGKLVAWNHRTLKRRTVVSNAPKTDAEIKNETVSKESDSTSPIKDVRWGIPFDASMKFDSTPLISYDDIRSCIKNNHEELEQWLEQLIKNNETLPMPLRPSSPEHKTDKLIRVDPKDINGKNIWFIGDIHGDFLSFSASLKSINVDPYLSSLYSSKTIIVLLGDIFDRLSDSFEVFFTVLWCMYKFHNIVWLSGNHDFITYNESTDSFYSPTSPSDYTQWLNDPNGAEVDEFQPIARQITKLFSKLIDSMPAGLYFPDGLLVSHGGFPHPHWYESIKKWQDFNNSNFVYDFYWKRLHETKRMVAYSNSGKTGQLGHEDFDSFCHLLKNRFKSPVSAFLRGHDHYFERVKFLDAYKLPVITFNTICCSQDGCDPLGKSGYQTTPVIIKYQPTIPEDYVSCAEMDAFAAQAALVDDKPQSQDQQSVCNDGGAKDAASVSTPDKSKKETESDSVPLDEFKDSLSDSTEDAKEVSTAKSSVDSAEASSEDNNKRDDVKEPEVKTEELGKETPSTAAQMNSAERTDPDSSEDKTIVSKEETPKSIPDSGADVDSAKQNSAPSPVDKDAKPMPVPNIVIYQLGITPDLLNEWYPKN